MTSTAGTLGTRPNHYAVLGVRPTASEEEIAQAFIRQMFSPRPMVQVAQIGAAYEVLRNPAKRRAYDASLGFQEERQGVLAKPVVAFSTRARYVAAAPAITFDPPVADPLPPAAPRAEVRPEPTPEPEIEAMLAADHAERNAGERGFGWWRPAVIAVGLVATVGLVGAWAGSVAGNDVAAEQVTVALPKAKPAAKAVAAAAVAAPKIAEARSYVPQQRVGRIRARPAHPDLQLEDLTKGGEAKAGQQHSYYTTTAADGTQEIAAADAPASTSAAAPSALVAAAGAAAATMPLSNATIAHTIHKIGYPCGAVASTEAVDGQAGAFTVTCTSGQTYRASPVKGRYRFKRI
jgi:DnaJ domain